MIDEDFKPSSARGTYCLTGNRNTELAIEGIAEACANLDDRWQAVPVCGVRIPLMGNPSSVPWDEDEARTRLMNFLQRVYSNSEAREREVQRLSESGARQALLASSTSGRTLIDLVNEGWAEFVQVGNLLGIQLTEKSISRISEHSWLS